ncbi:MAG: DUF3822 family protein [Bacteroidetes bacterium]|nr:MAG: DUF3822 family protein [Bacteroidota bacterium]
MNLKKLFHIQHDGQKEMIQPVLSISLGEKNFSFAISNAQANQLYHLASFSADEMNIEVLAEILSLHPEASASFYKVSVCYCYPQHILVPQDYYSNENFGELFKSVHGVLAGKNIVSESMIDWQLNDIYTVPQGVQQFLMRRYPSASFKNFPTLALKNLDNNEDGLLKVDFGVDEFELVAVNQNKLLLAERFEYATPHDVIYELLNLCNAYSLSQYKVQLRITGLVDKDSALYKEMYQYFMNIEFRNATWSHEDHPAHFFTVLNDIARCAL